MRGAKRLRWVRQQGCCLEGGDCNGPIEAHHPTGAGLALKSDDSTAFPLCLQHHTDRHSATGPFKTMTKAERKQWEAEMVAKYQALYDGEEETF